MPIGLGERLAAQMAAAQGGDRDAYRALLGEVAALLRRRLRATRRDLGAADIEDVVQEVLLSVHVARASYDPARPFLPWLLTIARYRIADATRRTARRDSHEVTTAEPPETSPFDGTNFEEESVGDPEALRAAMAALPPGQRQAVELVKLQEMSVREAAAATGVSESGIKVAVHRAIKALRAALASG